MLISPDEVKTKAKSKENENYAFRTYLKMHADPRKLDDQFRKLHEELFSGYDGEMSYRTKHCPCDFLKDDGACALGDCKPANCRRYPYTDQPDRMGSLLSIIESAEVCPVVYEILERLKEEYHFIKRKRVYPNDPCPCGSGLKYKKCCGKKR